MRLDRRRVDSGVVGRAVARVDAELELGDPKAGHHNAELELGVPRRRIWLFV